VKSFSKNLTDKHMQQTQASVLPKQSHEMSITRKEKVLNDGEKIYALASLCDFPF
jgi:hypothetical protein